MDKTDDPTQKRLHKKEGDAQAVGEPSNIFPRLFESREKVAQNQGEDEQQGTQKWWG